MTPRELSFVVGAVAGKIELRCHRYTLERTAQYGNEPGLGVDRETPLVFLPPVTILLFSIAEFQPLPCFVASNRFATTQFRAFFSLLFREVTVAREPTFLYRFFFFAFSLGSIDTHGKFVK